MKYIIVTGSVMSGIGKGITASSIGVVLKMHGLRVTSIKIDPYFNLDSGTMSPYEHGECYVLDDGGETDLDLGNYERFLGVSLTRDHNLTSGKIFNHVLQAERRGDYLGKTVQLVPHVTEAISDWLERVAQIPVTKTTTTESQIPEICIVELGGTVGDFESLPFVEAIRRLKYRLGSQNVLVVNVSYIPVLTASNETKTKPAQDGIQKLRALGLDPDVLCVRCSRKLSESNLEKLSNFGQIPKEQILLNQDVSNIYRIPLLFEKHGLYQILQQQLHLPMDLGKNHVSIESPLYRGWEHIALQLDRQDLPEKEIAIVGKYTGNPDSYLSLCHAIKHAGMHESIHPKITFVDAELLTEEGIHNKLKEADLILIPGGFGQRGIEGMIEAAKYARTQSIPCLGICLGFQIMVIEYARNVLGLTKANSTEFDPETPDPVIYVMDEHEQANNLGGTMRLGLETVKLSANSQASKIYCDVEKQQERHRHRYEVNPDYIEQLEQAGLLFSGRDESERRMEILELNLEKSETFYLGTQFHGEYSSQPLNSHPVFRAWLKSDR